MAALRFGHSAQGVAGLNADLDGLLRSGLAMVCVSTRVCACVHASLLV